jgi:hypothetical protein
VDGRGTGTKVKISEKEEGEVNGIGSRVRDEVKGEGLASSVNS